MFCIPFYGYRMDKPFSALGMLRRNSMGGCSMQDSPCHLERIHHTALGKSGMGRNAMNMQREAI
ncbi:MAG: hypothetical protein ACKOKH_02930, partial [Bacteroidota bacterium]